MYNFCFVAFCLGLCDCSNLWIFNFEDCCESKMCV